MSHLFEVEITTVNGSTKWNQRANSTHQISDCMPDAVKHYEAILLPLTSEASIVDNEELWHELSGAVGNIDEASEMTPDRILAEHALQRRALHGLTTQLK